MAEILLKRVYDDESGVFVREELLNEIVSPPPQPSDGDVIYVSPTFELGASSSNPSVGSGSIVAWYTKKSYISADRIELELYISNKGGSPGSGTGSYEVYLPEEIEPSADWYVGHANAWISGGGVSEFDGSVKWTLRNEEKGPKLIFTFDGSEWSPSHPKNYADFKLRANINYWL